MGIFYAQVPCGFKRPIDFTPTVYVRKHYKSDDPGFGECAIDGGILPTDEKSPWTETTRNIAWTPRIDVAEEVSQFNVYVELPGIPKEDINVDLHNKLLKISGEARGKKEFKDAEMILQERPDGRFERRVRLPRIVDPSKVEAKMFQIV